MFFSCLFPLETCQEESVHFLSKVRPTCLQFFVPISRAMEQKLLKYVPCNTLNSDSSAPLHWTTEDSCSVTSSSPGRNLVGVWQREFPSVTQTHENKFIDYCSRRGQMDIMHSYILLHNCPFITAVKILAGCNFREKFHVVYVNTEFQGF